MLLTQRLSCEGQAALPLVTEALPVASEAMEDTSASVRQVRVLTCWKLTCRGVQLRRFKGPSLCGACLHDFGFRCTCTTYTSVYLRALD